MAKKVVLEIDASPIERATKSITEEEKALARLRQAQLEHNKAVKASVEVENANEILQKQTATSYYEKQKVLTALGKVIRSYVATTDEEQKHLNSLKEQYSELNQELKNFDATMGNFQRNVGDYNNQVTKPITQQLKELQREMAVMIVNGKEGTAEYEQMAREAGRLQDAIGDARNEIKLFADDTKTLSQVVDITKTAVGAFGLLQSATALLGIEDEKLAKSIQKLQAAQTALASIQALQQTYLNKSSALYKLLNVEIVSYTGASKAARVATIALNTALKAIGIGLIVTALAYIVDHLKDIRVKLGEIIPFLRDEAAELEKIKQMEERRNEKIKERMLYEGKLKELQRARRVLEGDSLNVYKEILDEAKGIEASTKKTLDTYKKQIEGKKLINAQEKILQQFETDYAEAQLKRAQAEKQYNDELTKTKKVVKEIVAEFTDDGSTFYKEDAFGNAIDNLEDVSQYIEDDFIPTTEKQTYSIRDLFTMMKNDMKLSDEEQAQFDKFFSDVDSSIGYTQQIASSVFSSISSIYQSNVDAITKNINQIDKQITKAEKSINKHQNNITNLYQEASLARGAERDALLAAIDDEKKAMAEKEKEEKKAEKEKEKAELQQRKEEYKQKKIDLANQLIQAIANMALGISKSISQNPMGGGLPGSAIAASVGAIQIASISTQMGKLKMANGGLLQGNSHANGGIPVGNTGIEVEGGEYVINRRSTAQFLPLLDAINERGRRMFADGGVINLPSMDNTADMLSRLDINPVVSVVDINRANQRLTSVQALSR